MLEPSSSSSASAIQAKNSLRKAVLKKVSTWGGVFPMFLWAKQVVNGRHMFSVAHISLPSVDIGAHPKGTEGHCGRLRGNWPQWSTPTNAVRRTRHHASSRWWTGRLLDDSFRSVAQAGENKMRVVALILALAFAAVAIVYALLPAGSLPDFFPGFEAGSPHVHVKHAMAAAAVAVLMFAIGWYLGRSRA